MKQKIKIMKQKPELSDEEIRSYMDFDGLIAHKKLLTGEPIKLNWMKRIVPAIAVTAIAVWFLLYADKKTEPQSLARSVEQSPIASPNAEVPAIIKEENNDDVPQRPSGLSKPSTHKQKIIESPAQESKPLENIYVQAEPLEGYEALYEYFNSQLVYPTESIKDSVQGVQTISFVINRDGKPENIQIKQSLGEPFEREARRLIENMPVWKPATLNGKAVASQISLPLTFQIQKVKIK